MRSCRWWFLSVLFVVVWPKPTAGEEPLLMNVLSFDGNSGYVELPQNLFDRLNEGTIEVWVKWQSFQNWSRVIDFGHEENAFVVQNDKKSDTINFSIWDEGGHRHRIQAKKRVRKGVWHHLAMVFGRSGMAFYIDGSLIGTNDFEGGPNVSAGGNNYIGRSNWPKDQLFRGQMAELRVWDRRLSQDDLAQVKGRILRRYELGLVGYWRLDSIVDNRVPSVLEMGYPGHIGGRLMITTIPAIDRFLVPGELEKEADLAYTRGAAAFDAGDHEEAIAAFEQARSYVSGYKDADARRREAQRAWDLDVAEAAYAEGEARMVVRDPVRAYWAFDRAVDSVPDFRDAVAKRQAALSDASYSVGLFLLSSERIQESLRPKENEAGRWSRLASSIDRASRRDLSKRADVYGVYQNRIYSLFEEELRVGGLPYVQPIDRSRMGRLVSASGVRPSRAHLDQVLETCRKERIPVLVIGELTSAFTKHVSSRSNRVFWTVKKEEYTDDKGRKRTREIEDQSYRAHRTHASIEMACELRYMLVNVATGSIVNEGVLTDEASDKVDYISWNRRDEVNPADLRVKHGDGFKRVSSSDRNVIDARATLRSDEELFLENAPSLGRELAASLIESLRYYSPAP